MSITTPRYYVNAQTQTTPINIVTGANALTGGTISRVDRGSGVMVFRCSGANSTASYTALTTNSDGLWESPDLPIVFAVRAVVQAVPSDSFQRFVSFCIANDNENGFSLAKNGADNSQRLRNYLGGDVQAIGNPWGGGVLTTVVVRLVPAAGADHADIWIETVGRSGSTPDFTSPGAVYTEYRQLLDSCVVSPGTGTFDVARLALYAPEAISDADCAALADNFDGTIGGSVGIGSASQLNGVDVTAIAELNGISKSSVASRNGIV